MFLPGNVEFVAVTVLVFVALACLPLGKGLDGGFATFFPQDLTGPGSLAWEVLPKQY